MSEELKPCQFCNGEAQRTESSGLVSCAFEDCPSFLLAVPAVDWNRRAQPAEAEGVGNARLMNTLAELARRAPLRTLHTICETQRQVSTVKLERYLEPIGDTLAGYAFTLRIDFDKLSAALSAVTAERDRLLDQVKVLQSDANSWQSGYDKGRRDGTKHRHSEVAQLRAEVEALRVDATLGSAIQRACCDLPEGFMISVSLEKDAGTLELCLPDTDAVLDDFDGETFADQIHAAIGAAMAAKEA